jgi:hypothetical protein
MNRDSTACALQQAIASDPSNLTRPGFVARYRRGRQVLAALGALDIVFGEVDR